jgi:transposase
VGGEYVCHKFWEKLGLGNLVKELGVSPSNVALIEALVVGRLIAPGSELATHEWLEKRSGLWDLLKLEEVPSLSSFYRAGDILFSHKAKIEAHLEAKETALFDLKNTVVFYDLTKTYYEGRAEKNKKASYGRSKERRYDCKLVTLGLVVDAQGFAKQSQLFSGSESEGNTLKGMIESLGSPKDKQAMTVVLDAGIATSKNLAWLQENEYGYIVCHRGKAPQNPNPDATTEIIQSNAETGTEIKVSRYEIVGESYLNCRSERRKLKETGMRTLQETRFLAEMTRLQEGLLLPRRSKGFQCVLERVGRLKERYPSVARMYEIDLVPETGKSAADPSLRAIELKCTKKEGVYQASVDSEGHYSLRTNRSELSTSEIWNIYISLGRVEKAFRNMKSHLGFRPIFHQCEARADAHLFISVLAYHLLQAIEHTLRQAGDHRSWWSIKKVLSTHTALTLSYDELSDTQHWVKHHVRTTSLAEPHQKHIYSLLSIPHTPFKKRAISLFM